MTTADIRPQGVAFEKCKPDAYVVNAIENILMIGPFFLMAYYQISNGLFNGASCTCGWMLETPNGQTHIEPKTFIEKCAQHNYHHTKYVKVLDRYTNGKITYQQVHVDLMFHGMEDQRADDLLDEMRYRPHG